MSPDSLYEFARAVITEDRRLGDLHNKTALLTVLKARAGFPHSSVGTECASNAGDSGSIPGSRRSVGVRDRLGVRSG